MRARRAGEKGIVYVEPDQDEMDRRRERRTMSYDERHQTAPVSMNTMYDHLKKGPCKQTSYRPKVPVYETSSEEEAEPPKPEDKKEEKKDSPKVQKDRCMLSGLIPAGSSEEFREFMDAVNIKHVVPPAPAC